jgi:hypothetical protein
MAVGIKGVENRGVTVIKNEVYIRSFSSFKWISFLTLDIKLQFRFNTVKTQRIL